VKERKNILQLNEKQTTITSIYAKYTSMLRYTKCLNHCKIALNLLHSAIKGVVKLKKRGAEMPRKFTLKTARMVSGLSAQDVSARTGIHMNTIYSYENFKSYPPVDIAKKLADIYGIRFDDIIFFTDNNH
jgi:DNA-binding XRE family transcriptional regulator